jgi:hypothetical protein
MRINPLLDWAIFTFDELTSRISKFTNLDTAFADLPTQGVIGVVQLYDDVDGSRACYLVEPALFYIFVDPVNMWTGSDPNNITYRKRIGITLSAEIEGLWIPDPWYQYVVRVIRADSDFPNALDIDSMSGEQQKQFNAAVVVAGRAQDNRIMKLEEAIINAGGSIPLEDDI